MNKKIQPSAQFLSKDLLYNGVKLLVEQNSSQILLCQHKLYTLFTLAFQYLLYSSTKKSGHYLIRLENPAMGDKLSKLAKDRSTQKFMQSLLVSRRMNYQKSVIHLDFFPPNTWSLERLIPLDKLKMTIFVKDFIPKAMLEAPENILDSYLPSEDLDKTRPEDLLYELECLALNQCLQVHQHQNDCQIIVICPPERLESPTHPYKQGWQQLHFPFILPSEKSSQDLGVTLSKNLHFDWEGGK